MLIHWDIRCDLAMRSPPACSILMKMDTSYFLPEYEQDPFDPGEKHLRPI
jgi:hypothetical protein